QEGDSMSFIARASRLDWDAIGAERFSVPDTAWIDLEVSLRDTRSNEESRALAEERRWARTEAMEDSALARFFRASPEKWQYSMGVHYVLEPRDPKRPQAQSGQMLTIGYTARSLEDGRVIDDTYASGQHLTFRLGDPDQVIAGIGIAVRLLPEGGKGRFVIPSRLAFGADGSTGRIVPPYTPLLYELELRDVTGRAADTLSVDSAAVGINR
ncbi:MAG TPA: FKBP-type peptidyl-prolyl cis-trans isomerase, partial [Flavobacteriales bacterium]|nr:FKBP-type peptidyl-prolyl cis-trans isomerase [Flavobacteriales bacterium]